MRRETIELPEGQSFRLIRWSQSVSEVWSCLADGELQPLEGDGDHWHYHPEMELTLFQEGCGSRFVGDHIGNFSSGDLVLLGGMLPHHWHSGEKTAGLCLQWYFPPHHVLRNLPEAQGLTDLFQRATRGLHLVGKTHDRVADGIENLVQTGGLARLGKFLELLANLAEAPPSETESLASESFVLPSGATHQESMSRVMRHLVVYFRDEIHLDDVLKIAVMSRPTFSRQFKNHTGRSLTNFLLEIRLHAACQELLNTSHSILDVALNCGFGHVSFFNRVFKRNMGCSPSEFRVRKNLLIPEHLTSRKG